MPEIKHDLTSIVSPPFIYVVTVDDLPQEITLDFEEVAIQLQMVIPTAFQPYGSEVDENGNVVRGLQKVLLCLRDGKELPPSLPSWLHIMHAARKALRVPEKCGVAVVQAALGAWFEECARRNTLKKGTLDSQGSVEPTPASSTASA